MKNSAPKVLRFLVNLFVIHRATYFLGMVFVRLSRKMRHKYRAKIYREEMTLVPNAMGHIKMKVDKNSYMGGSIYWSGFHHVSEILFLNSFLTPDMVFVDVGANQGEFSLFAASRLKKGKVISFEPVKKQHDYLLENKALNQFEQIELYRYGLSDKAGSFPIYTSSDQDLHSGLHEGLSTLYQSGDRNEFEEEIELRVFDKEFENSLNRLDFIKIDVEGAELFALKGMEKQLTKFKPMILIEMNDDTFSAAGYSMREMSSYLSSLGYKAFPLRRGKLLSQTDSFDNWGNYIFKV